MIYNFKSQADTNVIMHEPAESRVLAPSPTMELVAGGDSLRLRARAGPLIELLRTSV